MGYKGVLFDFDGVLVDSEERARDAALKELQAAGFPYTLSSYVRDFTGLSVADYEKKIAQEHLKHFGKPVDPGFFKALSAKVKTAVQGVQPIPGAEELLKTLESLKIPFAIASNSDSQRLDFKLNKTGLRRYFNTHAYSAQLVARAKPAPDVYLHAASKLGVDAKDCFVVEDSLLGAKAGQAAQGDVIGFLAGAHDKKDMRKAFQAQGVAKTADDMKALERIILKGFGHAPSP